MPALPLYIPGIEERTHKVAVTAGGTPAFVYTNGEVPVSTQEATLQSVVPNGSTVFVTDEIRERMDMAAFVDTDVPFVREPSAAATVSVQPNTDVTIRAGHVLHVHAQKVNRNTKAGSDGMTLQLLDMNDQVIASRIIHDDGNRSGDGQSAEQQIAVTFHVKERGTYRLRVRAAQNTDFALVGLRVNTNRVSFEEVTLQAFDTVYMQVDGARALVVTPRYRSADPIRITNTVTGEVRTVDLVDAVSQQPLRVVLPPGGYLITAPIEAHFGNAYFGSALDTVFAPFVYHFTDTAEEATAIVTGLNVAVDSDHADAIRVVNAWNREELAHVTQPEQDRFVDVQYRVDVGESAGTAVTVDTTQQPEGFRSDVQYIGTQILGSARFVLYSEGTLDMDVVKQDRNLIEGGDQALVRVIDPSGTTVFSQLMSDGGDRTASNIPAAPQHMQITVPNTHGVYTVDVQSLPLHNQRNDFSITEIRVNTNKVFAESPVTVSPKTTVFTAAYGTADTLTVRAGGLAATAAEKPKDVGVVRIDTEAVQLTHERPELQKEISVGTHSVTVQHQPAEFDGMPIAWSAEGLFDHAPYRVGTDATATTTPRINFSVFSGSLTIRL
jgi:hypothetical protein